MKISSLLSCVTLVALQQANGFVTNPGSNPASAMQFQTSQLYSQTASEQVEPKTVDTVLTEMNDSGYPFRIVVIGNGAILETTSILGPTMKSSVSPKTGERLVTLASEDQSFEFHVKVDQVENVVFAETRRPIEGGEKVLRICRFMNGEGGSMCSLILNDEGETAIQWFNGMKDRFGSS